jgi:hypothetical protein
MSITSFPGTASQEGSSGGNVVFCAGRGKAARATGGPRNTASRSSPTISSFTCRTTTFRFGELSEAWTDEAVEKMLALGPHVIGVGTARNMTVPVTVRICKARPDISDASFERVSECTSRSTPAAS